MQQDGDLESQEEDRTDNPPSDSTTDKPNRMGHGPNKKELPEKDRNEEKKDSTTDKLRHMGMGYDLKEKELPKMDKYKEKKMLTGDSKNDREASAPKRVCFATGLKPRAKSKPNFDLDDGHLLQQVEEFKLNFYPILSVMSLKSLKTIADTYPLPTSGVAVKKAGNDNRISKVAKADDARVPTILWDTRVANVLSKDCSQKFCLPTWCSLGFLRSVDILRDQLTAYACRLLQRSFFKWFRQNYRLTLTKDGVCWSERNKSYSWSPLGKDNYSKDFSKWTGRDS